ncbi:MAG: hypothetical protein MAG451_00619 [Anaerolineales bacterium]|nr:hypothetical protein [Anaerolineales bacterium]
MTRIVGRQCRHVRSAQQVSQPEHSGCETPLQHGAERPFPQIALGEDQNDDLNLPVSTPPHVGRRSPDRGETGPSTGLRAPLGQETFGDTGADPSCGT